MKVKQLIKELKQMPQNLEVEVAMHDNSEYESAACVCSVDHFVKSDYEDVGMSPESRRVFVDMRAECVILRC
ncbi:MAG: hypothetical protein BA864_04740 [Desulfuromonadales bacterium C00003093]|nr:MAG: hypothetical protein BA864_04740 [Desulfuromonadales bacterium C00003093]